jgi:hypothetical protein
LPKRQITGRTVGNAYPKITIVSREKEKFGSNPSNERSGPRDLDIPTSSPPRKLGIRPEALAEIDNELLGWMNLFKPTEQAENQRPDPCSIST